MKNQTKPVGTPTPGGGFAGGILIPVASIAPNPNQPRQVFDDAALKELASSIQQHGLIQPITVELAVTDESDIYYILHDGERRLRAHKLLGWPDIPAFILSHEHDGEALLMRAIVANDQRSDLTAIERAQGYQKLVDEYGLSDIEIGVQVGKSRSTVANIRRLLQLPAKRQQQVAAGELSERQATALLPLYQLPAATQSKLLDTYDGRKLKNPDDLTSDQIRSLYRSAVRTLGQTLKHFEADQIFPAFNGVRNPTCTGCDLYITIGKDKSGICLDDICHTAKKDQVVAGYLSQAQKATGLPTLDLRNSENYSQVSEFYDSGGEPALAIAQEKNCANLRLAYNLNSWNGGLGPDGFDRCRYVCYHNGQKCACASQLTADQGRQKAEQKKAVQQLGKQAAAHLSELADADPEKFLAAILHATTHTYNGYNDKVLSLPPDKVRRHLARWLLSSVRLSDWKSLADNQEKLNNWLTNVGFPPLETIDPLHQLATQLERLEVWLSDESTTPATLKAIDSNLAQLAEQLAAAPDGEPKQGLIIRLEAAKSALLLAREIAGLQGSLNQITATELRQLVRAAGDGEARR